MGVLVSIFDNFPEVERKERIASFKNVGHASASIRKSVIGSIKIHPDPSPVGTPVHSRVGLFKTSLFYHVSALEIDSVIGLAYSKVDDSGEPHEKGIFYKGYKFSKRPFMYPGLVKAAPRLSAHWSGTIG